MGPAGCNHCKCNHKLLRLARSTKQYVVTVVVVAVC